MTTAGRSSSRPRGPGDFTLTPAWSPCDADHVADQSGSHILEGGPMSTPFNPGPGRPVPQRPGNIGPASVPLNPGNIGPDYVPPRNPGDPGPGNPAPRRPDPRKL